MSGIPLTVVPTPEDVHAAFAHIVADAVTEANETGRDLTLILPVGPLKGYPILQRMTNTLRLDWRRVGIVTMDEYLDWSGRPVPDTHPLSFTGFMRSFLAGIDEQLRPRADAYVAPDPFDIDRASDFLASRGGADLCLGGIGVHGHVAFNEPPLSRFGNPTAAEFRDGPTRVVALAPETIVMNATRSVGGRFEGFPSLAVTLGMRDLFAARRVRLFADGGVWQQRATLAAVEGPISTDYPVSLFAEHPDVHLTAWEESAGLVSPRT